MPSQTPSRQFKPFHLRSIIVLFGCLLLAEFALRQDQIGRQLPTPTTYYSTFVDAKLERFTAFIEREQQPDVLFIGSSATFFGIDPLLFDQVVAGETQRSIVSFNGAMIGLAAGPTVEYLENFWFENATPSVIVQGIRYTEVIHTQSTAEITFFNNGIHETHWIDPSFKTKVRLWLSQFEQSYIAQKTGALAEVIALPTGEYQIDERGFSTGYSDYPSLAQLLQQQPIESIQHFKEYEDVATPFAARDSTIGLNYLENAIQLAQARGIEYIVVNIPDYPPKFDAATIGRENYAQYLEQVRSITTQYDVPFVDVMEHNWEAYSTPEWYIDVVHLSPAGAEKFTHDLAVELAPYLGDD